MDLGQLCNNWQFIKQFRPLLPAMLQRPLVGRDREIKLALTHLFDPGYADAQRIVPLALAAAPGAGKTAFVDHVAELVNSATGDDAKAMCVAVSISWNGDTSVNTEEQHQLTNAQGVSDSIAVRLAFAAFHAHMPFARFWKAWSQAGGLALEEVLGYLAGAVQTAAKNKLLILVDEPNKSSDATTVRRTLVNALNGSAFLSRTVTPLMLITALRPSMIRVDGQLEVVDASSSLMSWLPLSTMRLKPAAEFAEQVFADWIKQQDTDKLKAKAAGIVRYVMDLMGHSWRARQETIAALLKERRLLTSIDTALSAAIPVGLRNFGIDASHRHRVSALDQFVVHSVLCERVQLVAPPYEDEEGGASGGGGGGGGGAAAHLRAVTTSPQLASAASAAPAAAATAAAASAAAAAAAAGQEGTHVVTEIQGKHPSFWASVGLLSNSIDASCEQQEVPVVPLLAVYARIRVFAPEQGSVTEAVSRLLKDSHFPLEGVPECQATRFELVGLRAMQVVLRCYQLAKVERFHLVEMGQTSDTPRGLLRGFRIVGDNPASRKTFRTPDQVKVLHLQQQLTSSQAGSVTMLDDARQPQDKDQPTSLPSGSLLRTMTGETAVDFFLWLDGTLFAIQSRNLAEAHGVDALLKDIAHLTRFRDVLWRNAQNELQTAPTAAKRLGLPLISERDVIFVLLARSGLSVPKQCGGSGGSGAGGSGGSGTATGPDAKLLQGLEHCGWAGGLIVPGTRAGLKNLDPGCSTWLDLILGPTFAPLVHLLGL